MSYLQQKKTYLHLITCYKGRLIRVYKMNESKNHFWVINKGRKTVKKRNQKAKKMKVAEEKLM